MNRCGHEPGSARPNGAGPITLIAAIDHNRAIGRGGTMPWRLPDDLRRFKALTMGKPTLMGRKTACAIGSPLPGRPNLVLTRAEVAPFAGQIVVASFDAAVAFARGGELMVIGGGEVYALALPWATRLHLTQVDAVTPGADTFFPALEPGAWAETARRHHPADAQHRHPFDFVDYQRSHVGTAFARDNGAQTTK